METKISAFFLFAMSQRACSSSESDAPNVDDEHFVGTGWIRVLTDERIQPTMLILR